MQYQYNLCCRRVALLKCAGFSLLELLVTLAVFSVALTALIPSLHQQFERAKFFGVAREVGAGARLSRSTAIKIHSPVVLVVNPVTGTLMSYVDVNRNDIFDPDSTKPKGTVDYQVMRLRLNGVIGLGAPTGEFLIEGFEPQLNGRKTVFGANGTVSTTGAVRLSDGQENFLEVRIAPLGTARVSLRKYDVTRPANEEGTHWYGRREGGQAWRWNS